MSNILIGKSRAFQAVIFCFILGALLFAGQQVLAAVNTTSSLSVDEMGVAYGNYTGLAQGDVRMTIANIIRVALQLLGIVAVVIVLIGGFKWMTAGGNDEQVGEAKKWIFSGMIGLAIVMSAYAIAQFAVNSLVSASGGTVVGGTGGGSVTQQCDDKCESSDAVSCPSDCVCNNNGTCDTSIGETHGNCLVDCPIVQSETCPDNQCLNGETAFSCLIDCHCGDLSCASGDGFTESATVGALDYCAADCACENGTCDPGETAASCSVDCGCDGDGVCESSRGETSACPADNCS